MDDFLQAVTSDFGGIATLTGFRFNQYSGSVDWENLDNLVLDDIIENADANSLSKLVASVLSYNIEKMSASKKIFRLSQLIIDFLLHYKKHSILKFNNKVNSIELCDLCGKMFVDIASLKDHCFRQLEFNSCNYSPPKVEHIESLKAEIFQLQTQLKIVKSTSENKFQNSKTCLEELNHNNCDTIHENKILYHLVSQPGDNPMQIQEMYWKQKYNSLEENYNTLKNELRKQNTSITTTDVHNKYQQCDLNKTEKCTVYTQTSPVIETTSPTCSPKRPPRKNNMHSNENKETCHADILDPYQTKSECHLLNGNLNSDKDFYELKKLRLEARMNIHDNKVCENYSEPLLSSDYVEKIKIELILGQTQVNELFNNTSLMDLIKLDIKELVNKRFEECYRFVDEDAEQYNILHLKNQNKIQEMCDVSISEDYNMESLSPPKIEKITTKKNKTVMSKLKKKALHFSTIFSSDSKNKIIKTENTIKQDLGLSHSNSKLNNDDLNE